MAWQRILTRLMWFYKILRHVKNPTYDWNQLDTTRIRCSFESWTSFVAKSGNIPLKSRRRKNPPSHRLCRSLRGAFKIHSLFSWAKQKQRGALLNERSGSTSIFKSENLMTNPRISRTRMCCSRWFFSRRTRFKSFYRFENNQGWMKFIGSCLSNFCTFHRWSIGGFRICHAIMADPRAEADPTSYRGAEPNFSMSGYIIYPESRLSAKPLVKGTLGKEYSHIYWLFLRFVSCSVWTVEISFF